MKSFIGLALSALFVLSKAQDSCQWYDWTAEDWPNGTTQDFEELMRSQSQGQFYLDDSDFAENGNFYGETWEERFWKNPNRYRPYGFKYAQVGAFNDPTVCLNATGVAGYKVELMVYTLTPEASLCVADMGADAYNTQQSGAMGTCDTEYIYQCFTADTNDPILQVSVYCETNCQDNQEVNILYRFRRSKFTWSDEREYISDNPEMWCDMIGGDIVWPDEIVEAIPETFEPNENLSGSTMITSIVALMVASLFALLQ